MRLAFAACALTVAMFTAGCSATGSSTAEKSPEGSVTPTTAPQTTASSPTQEPTEDPSVFGPVSVAGVSLGMTLDQLRTSGAATFPDGEGDGQGCVWFGFANLPEEGLEEGMGSYDGTVGPNGVELLAAREGMKTPEGIGLGSTKAEALAAYPMAKFQPDYGNYRAHVAGQPEDVAYYFSIRGGKVRNLNISPDTPQCFN